MLRFIRPAVSAGLPVAGGLFSRSRITQESAEQQQFMRNEIQLSRNVLLTKKCGSRLEAKSLPIFTFVESAVNLVPQKGENPQTIKHINVKNISVDLQVELG